MKHEEASIKPEKPLPRIEISESREEDSLGASKVLKASWIDTYPNEEHGVLRHDIERRADRFDDPSTVEERRKLYGKGSSRFVAREGDKVVGFIHVDPKVNEVCGLYVHPDYLNTEDRRLDIGRRLFQAGLEALDTSRDIFLWVTAYNDRAIRFYEKQGFELTKEKRPFEYDEGKTMPTVKMVRAPVT